MASPGSNHRKMRLSDRRSRGSRGRAQRMVHLMGASQAVVELPRAFRASCWWCQFARASVKRTFGKRLGRRERDLVLRAASGASEGWTPLVPEPPTNAGQVATRRAVASLREVGLLGVSAPRRVEHDGRVWRLRAIKRTPLADEIEELFRDELRTGARIRWVDGGLQEAFTRCAQHCHHPTAPGPAVLEYLPHWAKEIAAVGVPS